MRPRPAATTALALLGMLALALQPTSASAADDGRLYLQRLRTWQVPFDVAAGEVVEYHVCDATGVLCRLLGIGAPSPGSALVVDHAAPEGAHTLRIRICRRANPSAPSTSCGPFSPPTPVLQESPRPLGILSYPAGNLAQAGHRLEPGAELTLEIPTPFQAPVRAELRLVLNRGAGIRMEIASPGSLPGGPLYYEGCAACREGSEIVRDVSAAVNTALRLGETNIDLLLRALDQPVTVALAIDSPRLALILPGQAPFCGDGRVDADEQCDDVDGIIGPSCDSLGLGGTGNATCSDCRWDTVSCEGPACGDGAVDLGEECGEPGLPSQASCESLGLPGSASVPCNACRLDISVCLTESCGDGTVGPGEECEPGAGRQAACVTPGGYVGSNPELCGGPGEAQACRWQTAGPCVAIESCGDAELNGREQCDGAARGSATCSSLIAGASGSLGCQSDCSYDVSACSYCGDGARGGGEICDGADLGGRTCAGQVPGATGVLACEPDCRSVDIGGCRYCGDGVRGGSEVCDATDLGGGSCATATGVSGAQGTLRCDSGCALDKSGCRWCGDRIRNGSETCDGGSTTCGALLPGAYNASTAVACNTSCSGYSAGACQYCGDDKLNGSEACDGAALGGKSCASLFTGGSGTLRCGSSCAFDTSGCTAPAAPAPIRGASYDGRFCTLDLATGTASGCWNSGLGTLAAVADLADGRLYAIAVEAVPGSYPPVSRNVFYRVNPSTGEITAQTAPALPVIYEGDLARDAATGLLYGVQALSGPSRNLFTINPTTGAGRLVGAIAGVEDVSALAFDANGRLFALDSRVGAAELLELNKASGQILSRRTLDRELGVAVGMRFAPNGTLYVADGHSFSTDQLFAITPGSGALAPVGATRVGGLGALFQ